MADSEQPVAAAAAPASTNLGQILREARVAKDLTIDQLATELRIEARQLAALEDNRFEQIGVPVFVKGYIRQYAQRLGVDQARLIELYGRQTKLAEVDIKPTKPIRLRDERQITVWVVAALVLLLIAVGLAVWWLNGAGFDFGVAPRGASTPAAAPAPASPAPIELAPAATEPAGDPAAADVTTAPSEVEPAAPVAQPAPAAPSPATPPVARASLAQPVASTAGGGASRGATPIPLDVTFDGESWAEITDARGQRLFFDLGSAGKHVVLRGEPPISVTFGNSGVVRLLVDGERYPIPGQAQGKLVRFSIASDEE